MQRLKFTLPLFVLGLLPSATQAQTPPPVTGRLYGVRLSGGAESVNVGSGRRGVDGTADATAEMGFFGILPGSVGLLNLDLLGLSPSIYSNGFEAPEYARDRGDALSWIRLHTGLEGFVGPMITRNADRQRCNVAFTVGGGMRITSQPVITDPDFVAIDVGGALACVDTHSPEHPRGFILQAGAVAEGVAFSTLNLHAGAGAVLRVEGFLDEDVLARLTARWHESLDSPVEERSLSTTGQLRFSVIDVDTFHLMVGLEGTVGYNRSVGASFPSRADAPVGAGCLIAAGVSSCPTGEGFNFGAGLNLTVAERSVSAASTETPDESLIPNP